MSEKILLAEIRDLYSSNNCEDVIEKSIKKIYKILKRSDINSAFKNSFRKKVDIPIHKIFKDRIEYFTTDYIDTLTNVYTILFILTKYLRYLENDDLKYNVIHSESTTLFTIFEFIKENGISCQTSEDYYSLIVLYDNLNNMTVKDIKLDFLKKCDVKHPKDVLKIINGEKTEEQRDMLSFNVNSTDKHESSVFRKIRRRNSKVPFAIYLSLLLCVLTILSCAIPPYIPQLSLILSSAAFAITAMVEPNEDLANGDSDARSTSQGVTLVKNSQNSNALSTKILDGRGVSLDQGSAATVSTESRLSSDHVRVLAKQPQYTSKRLKNLYKKRNNSIQDYLHKLTKFITNYCVKNEINTVIIGDLTGIKNRITNRDKKYNQKLHELPYEKIRILLEYKLACKGINFVLQNECYTSQCAPNTPSVERKYANKSNRVQRGLYASEGNIYNADAVGAYNILRKYCDEHGIKKTFSIKGLTSVKVFKIKR